MSRIIRFLAAFPLVLLLSCQDQVVGPEFRTPALGPSFAKGGGGNGKGGGKGEETVWTVRVNDDPQYKVRSDGKGAQAPNLYSDDEPCVGVRVSSHSGHEFLHFRTASNFCTPIPRGEFRFLTLDLGEGNGRDLDQDGMLEVLEEVPVRFWAHEAFNDEVQTTPVEIWILEIDEQGTTQQNAWELHYLSEARVDRFPDGSTVISLGPDEAAADLCEVVAVPVGKNKLKRECQFRAMIPDLPFHMTVAPK